MISKVLILCHANVCRSPMAEALFRQIFPEVSVASAGLDAEPGRPPAPYSVEASRELGLDIGSHRASRITRAHLSDADLILTMSEDQVNDVCRIFPPACGKVFRIGQFLGEDISDPIGRELQDFRACRDLLKAATLRWAHYIEKSAGAISPVISENGK